MAENSEFPVLGLTPPVERMLRDFVEASRQAFEPDLLSVILYGSGAEGRLRATSDVNVLLLLSTFDQAKAHHLQEPLRVAHAAIRLTVMFLLQTEVEAAAAAFAEKFSDILRRRTILYGSDPFVDVAIPRSVTIARLKQVLLNLTLRLREAYVLRGLREEQLVLVVADSVGPLRSCAATLLELEGSPAPSAKEALARTVSTFPGADWKQVLAHLSQARETRTLPSGSADVTLFRLMELTQHLRARAETLT